jgi:hypothetical protein
MGERREPSARAGCARQRGFAPTRCGHAAQFYAAARGCSLVYAPATASAHASRDPHVATQRTLVIRCLWTGALRQFGFCFANEAARLDVPRGGPRLGEPVHAGSTVGRRLCVAALRRIARKLACTLAAETRLASLLVGRLRFLQASGPVLLRLAAEAVLPFLLILLLRRRRGGLAGAPGGRSDEQGEGSGGSDFGEKVHGCFQAG